MAENQGTGNLVGDQNWERVRTILDDPELGPSEFSGQEWATTAEQMEAIRERIRANPRAAVVEARTFAEVTNRVRTLKAIRKARGLTQQQISDQLRISQGEVSRIERRGNLHLSTFWPPVSSKLPAISSTEAAYHCDLRRPRNGGRCWRSPPRRTGLVVTATTPTCDSVAASPDGPQADCSG